MSKNVKDLHFSNDKQFMNFLICALSDSSMYDWSGQVGLDLSDLNYLAKYVQELQNDSGFVVSDPLNRVLKMREKIVNSEDLPYFQKLIIDLDKMTMMIVKKRKDPMIDILLKAGAVVLSLDDLPDENRFPDLATVPDLTDEEEF